jgi:SAM-dependent methyltransferase
MTQTLDMAASAPDLPQIVLHAGCGRLRKENLPPGFRTVAWREIRYDINPDVQPDIVGSITDMSPIASDSIDSLFNSHVIEHLYPHEVPIALREFRRVVKEDGFIVLTCPDIQSVAEHVARGNLLEPLYMASDLPIAPIDILYGLRAAMAQGNLHMAHRTAFTARSLFDAMIEAGFSRVRVARSNTYALWALGTKQPLDDDELAWLTRTFFPPQNAAPVEEAVA